MKTIWGAVLLAMMMLATAALAADLDTPQGRRGGLRAGGGKRLGRAA